MGCDIHLFAEKKDKDKWRMITDAFEQYDGKRGNELDVGRNYELFAFLADVRNYNGIKPLSSPRGVPVDASLRYQAEVEDWGEDGHSHSHFTIAELKAIPKELSEQEFQDEQLITAKNEDGKVTETCRWTSGKHLGAVGKRKLFTLWGVNPIEKIIQQVEEATEYYKLPDDHKRIVFFFDN